MSSVPYKPVRQGIEYPAPTTAQWRRILRKCRHAETGYKSACWIWTGRLDPEGYGECKFNGAKRFVHRIAYAWKRGKTPAGRVIDHKCRQRACCNPAHVHSMSILSHNRQSGLCHESPIQVTRANLDLPF